MGCFKSSALAVSTTRALELILIQRLGMSTRTCMSRFYRTSSVIAEQWIRLFIDQPAGAGFSYGTKNVDTSQKAAVDVWQFLQIWFADPRFKKYNVGREFGIWTESYGGHYGPVFASCVPRCSCIRIVNCELLQVFLAAERCDPGRVG